MDVAKAKALSREEINEHLHASTVDPSTLKKYTCIHCNAIAEVFLYEKTRVCPGDNFFYTCLEHCKHDDVVLLDGDADDNLYWNNPSDNDSDDTETEVEDACEETDTEDEEEEEVVEKGQARVGAEDEAGDGDASEKVASSAEFSFCYDKEKEKNATRRTVLFLAGLTSV
jgi:hypothetical protein